MHGLEDLYREIILDHYRSPRNRGELAVPPAVRSEGYNPLCGDEITVYLETEGDIITDIRIQGQGCSISQSSASMMSAAVKGQSFAHARELIKTFKGMMSIHESSLDSENEASEDSETSTLEMDMGELDALRGVVKFPTRIKCATLAWNTLAAALNDVESATKSS